MNEQRYARIETEAYAIFVTLNDAATSVGLRGEIEKFNKRNPNLIPALQKWAEERGSECVVQFGRFAQLSGNVLTVETDIFSLTLDFTKKRDIIPQIATYFNINDAGDPNTLLNLRVWARSRNIPVTIRPVWTKRGLRFWIDCMYMHRYDQVKPVARRAHR